MLLSRSIRARQLGDSYIEISKYVRFQLRQRQLGSANATKASVLPVRQSSTTSAQDPERQLDKRPGHLTQDVGANASSGKPELAGRDYACLRRFQGSCLSQHEITTWDSLAKTEIPTHSSDTTNEPNLVRICGYITSQRSAGKFEFFQLVDPGLELAVQVICSKQKLEQNVQSEADHGRRDTPEEVFNLAKDIRGHTPVQVIGSVVQRAAPPKKKGQTRSSQQLDVQNGNTLEKLDPFVGQINLFSHIEIQADSIIPLNTFPTDLVAKCDTVFPPELRHLQFRTDNELRSRIRLRSKVAAKVREGMLDKDFDEIETPLLFKSTPEGAREFIVPTRKKGMAYALPQSPQQYKQVLMASGIPRYFQFAKCFRDEDLRADRQPEFTQLDLEMSFVGAEQVMSVVEDIVRNFVWPNVPKISPLNPAFIAGESPTDMSDKSTSSASPFPRFSYNSVMARYGSDKPDTRLGSEIHRIEEWLPPNVKGMLTSLDDPIVEMIKIDMHGTDPPTSSQFVRSFLDAPTSSVYTENPAGMPGVSVYDAGKPLRGLASFGHEAAYKVEEDFEPEPGDIFIVQTRANAPFTGGSTILGNLRRDILHSAISQGLIAAPSGFAALWVTDFPLFSPIEESEPGQGGMAGICSTHHPFTAPKQGQELSLLMTDPLKVIGDHYDLVINGVEVGGGSRRIQIAEMQEIILRDILKLAPERLEDFRHLLNALRCGCPPHAGFALGFDRLMAMLTDRASVRDVIAFPKYADGEDKFVKSPSLMTADQLATYHLAITDKEVANPPPPVSRRA